MRIRKEQTEATDARPLRRTRIVVRACAGVVAAALVAVPFAMSAFADPYAWYTGHSGSVDDPYVINNANDWCSFADAVNGKADMDNDGNADAPISFEGKVVKLGGEINFQNTEVTPAGGLDGCEFDGTFDGDGHTLNNFYVAYDGRDSNVGLIGKAGADSVIKNVTVGKSGSCTIARDKSTKKQLSNIGLLVGQSEGSLENCSNEGSLSVSHEMNQTRDVVYPIKSVGTLAGKVVGSVTGCSNSGSLSVHEGGVPFSPTDEGDDWEDQSALAIQIGGVVGCAGDDDSSVDAKSSRRHGSISSCANSGTLSVDVPQTNGEDRFGNTVYSQASMVGGIAGYARGDVSDCSNSGTIAGDHATAMGGIVGSLRGRMSTSSYSGNFTSDGTDDGDASDVLTAQCCQNSATLTGHAFVGGIVGRAGSYVNITACINQAEAEVKGTRTTKPFPSGIVGSTYGTVSYCANLGTVGSYKADGSIGSGYYAAGIAGNTVYWTKQTNNVLERTTPLPEVYGCYNAGSIEAQDGMRQRALVGDNAGYVHDNVAEKDKVYQDRLVYGDSKEDSESSGGTVRNNILLDNDQMTGDAVVDAETGSNVFTLLNKLSEGNGFEYYWVKSHGENSGYPVLFWQTSEWSKTDLSGATVSLKANAEYTGLDAVPFVTVTMPDGTALTQDVDFRVIAQKGATEVTEDDETPYTATVVGIGSYEGTAAATVRYGIGKGDLSNCSVTIDSARFNWEVQNPTVDKIHVRNAGGVEMDSSEFTVELDPSFEKLTDGNAVNAARYPVIIKPVSGSEHFYGELGGGIYSIRTVDIVCNSDAEKQEQTAYPVEIEYQGKTYSWDSQTKRADLPAEDQFKNLQRFDYTGRAIKPKVTKVVYLGRELVEGTDYRVVYGEPGVEGADVVDNVGYASGTARGYITVRYIPGGNFANYDNMAFEIVDEGTELSLDDAVIKGTDKDIVFEAGSSYKPVEVYYGGSKLVEGEDYHISYKNNDKVGTAEFTITAGSNGRFTGTKTGSFNIVEGYPYVLSYSYDDATRTATVAGVVYQGSNDDFDLVIPEKVEYDGAEYTVTAIGANAFGGSGRSDFEGSEQNLSKQKIRSVKIPATVAVIGDCGFGSSTPQEDMKNLVKVEFEDASQLKTVGDYAFTRTGISEITLPASLESIGKQAFAYCASLKRVGFMTESAELPAYNATSTGGSFRECPKDVVVAGHPQASSVKELAASKGWAFTDINPTPVAAVQTVSTSKAAYTLVNGKSASLGAKAKTALSYRSSNAKVATVSASGKITAKGVGTAKVTVTAAATGSCKAATRTVTVKVNPKGTKLSKAKGAKKSLKATWKKASKADADGYQLRWSTAKKMTKAKSARVTGYKATSKTIKKLKGKKTYYVQVRTYKKVGGKTYWSAWSTAKKAKTK